MLKSPYREEGNPPILRPTIDVRLERATAEWTTRALIDTGSPLTLFDRGAADALCIRMGSAGAETGSIAVLGAVRRVQYEYVELSLPRYPAFSWTAHVAFTTDPQFQMAFQGILGVEGFLDKFVVTFNAYENFFVVERPDEWRSRNGSI